MSSNVISFQGLRPGQWVIFTHDKGEISKKLQGPFKVINRHDAMYNLCRCVLMNVEGEPVDYWPGTGILGGKILPWECNVEVLSHERIAKELGEKMEEVQKKAFALSLELNK